MDKCSKDFSVGQPVWIMRSSGPVQQAVISSLLSVSSPNSPVKPLVSVEWVDENGVTLGKTLSPNDVFPRCPKTDTFNISATSVPNSENCNLVDDHQVESERNSHLINVEQGSSDGSAETIVCRLCKLGFKSSKGLRIHVAKKHPIEANRMTVDKLLHGKVEDHGKEVVERKEEVKKWCDIFREMFERRNNFNAEEFESAINGFHVFLREANNSLPGPKHPAVRFYKLRKQNKLQMKSKGTSQVSNPTRTNKAARERRKEQYMYEVAQHNYYNRRKKVVQDVMNANKPKQCPVNKTIIEKHYKSVFESCNSNTFDVYDPSPVNPDICTIDLQIIQRAIKSTSLDTSPGNDGVLIRTIKCLHVAHIIKLIADIMLKTSYVPEALREGRTTLIYKGKGSVDDIASWRPITIFPIIRRIIEKALDVKLRQQISFHSSQRGFVNGLPGCHVNTRIINAILQSSREQKSDCVIAFLDVCAAFDNIGHEHILRTLTARGISADVHNLVSALLTNNKIRIGAGLGRTDWIRVGKGVPQGGPLSPTLFNIGIDYLYHDICDSQVASHYGYKLSDNHNPIILTGFADDQAVTSNSIEGAQRVVGLLQRRLLEIGLAINPRKSSTIIISKGCLQTNTALELDNGDRITSTVQGERIKYLGCNFEGELVFNEDTIRGLNDDLNKLIVSNLLKPDQKLNITNQYVFPKITYPLQAAPLVKVKKEYLDGADTMIRRSMKAILGLPANANSAMLYAPRRYRGLGLLKCEWEAPLQHLSLIQKLNKVNDTQFKQIFNFHAEVANCVTRLGITDLHSEAPYNVRKMRQTLREKSFEEWSCCKWQGIGVAHFKENTAVNKFMSDKLCLSGSEWTNALKLNMNYAPLRGVPGVKCSSTEDVGTLCRKCGRETETPAHVLGSCPNNMLLVTNRHHKVKRTLIELLKERGYSCLEEAYAVDTEGATRYADIIAFPKYGRKALIIDPTVRFESNDPEQAHKVHLEKSAIYSRCIDFYKERLSEEYGDREYTVRGLWFGARGTIPKTVSDFFDEVGIDQKHLRTLAENIIIDSLGIISNHLYST